MRDAYREREKNGIDSSRLELLTQRIFVNFTQLSKVILSFYAFLRKDRFTHDQCVDLPSHKIAKKGKIIFDNYADLTHTLCNRF